MEINIGDKIGRYQIVEEIGKGGAAVVYRALDTTPELERYVAIKMMLSDFEKNDKFMKRFQREARLLAQLSHPSVVKVLDFGEFEDTPFLVMEYVPNGSLLSRMGTPFSPDEAAALLLPIARALEHAHKKNVVHRDIKPANILINNAGQPMLSDFGIARLMNVDESQSLTGTGVMIGTPAYMAPEQIQGEVVDGRADIYALGILFFELVTGKKPYAADTPIEMALKHLHDPMPRPRQLVRSLPMTVEKVILKATAKKPHDRYQEMGQFAFALDKIASGVKWDGKIDKKYEKAAHDHDVSTKSRSKMGVYYYGIGGALFAFVAAAVFLFTNICPPFIPACAITPEPIVEPSATPSVTIIPPSSTVTPTTETASTATAAVTPTVTFTPAPQTPTRAPTPNFKIWVPVFTFDFPIHSMDWSPDGNTIIVGGTEKITAINTDNYNQIVIPLIQREVVEDIFFTNDSSEVVVRIGNTIRFYNLETKTELARLEGNDYTGLLSISVSNDRKYMAVGRSNKNVKVIDIAEKKVIWWTDNSFFKNNKVAIETTADNQRYLATATGEGVMLWKWIEATERFEKQIIDSPKENFDTVAFSSDGNYLTASTGNEVLVWFIGSKEPKRLDKVEGAISVIQFLPDNSLIALGYEDGSVRLYDPFSLRSTFIFPNRYNQEIKGIKFSPSADTMVSGSTGGVWVWAAP